MNMLASNPIQIPSIPSKDIRYALSDEEWQRSCEAWSSVVSILSKIPTNDRLALFTHDSIVELVISYLRAVSQDSEDELTDGSRHVNATELENGVYQLLLSLYSSSTPTAIHSLSTLLLVSTVFGRRNFNAIAQAIARSIELNETIDDEVEEFILSLESSLTRLSLASSSEFDICIQSCQRTIERAICFSICCTNCALLGRASLGRILIRYYSSLTSLQNLIKSFALVLMTHRVASLKFLDVMSLDMESNSLLRDLCHKTRLIPQLKTLSQTREELQDLVLQLDQSFTMTQDGKLHGQYDERQDEAFLTKMRQIQDLFPDLAEDYVAACLRRYGQDLETVTMHLLDDDVDLNEEVEDLTRNSSTQTLPTRHNIYDGDDFDRLAIEPELVHKGHSDYNAGVIKGIDTDVRSKIISLALAADEDEPDDTYAGMEGTVANDWQTTDDLHAAAADEAAVDDIDTLLYTTFETNPAIFERTARMAVDRRDLKSRTGLTDEQIEGWRSMLDRDPTRRRQLARKQELAFRGNNETLQSTRWHKKSSSEDNGTLSLKGDDLTSARLDTANTTPSSAGIGSRGAPRGPRGRGRAGGQKNTRGQLRGRGRGGKTSERPD